MPSLRNCALPDNLEEIEDNIRHEREKRVNKKGV
jgi:hypothetical protein